MREWPSIVPGAPEDYYIVINHYGEFGPAFAETDLYRANLETTISDLMTGPAAELSLKVGDGGNREGGISWGCLTPPLLHRRSDMPCPKITSSS